MKMSTGSHHHLHRWGHGPLAHASKTRRSLFGLRVLGEDGTSEGLRHLGLKLWVGLAGCLGCGPPKQPSEFRPEVHHAGVDSTQGPQFQQPFVRALDIVLCIITTRGNISKKPCLGWITVIKCFRDSCVGQGISNYSPADYEELMKVASIEPLLGWSTCFFDTADSRQPFHLAFGTTAKTVHFCTLIRYNLLFLNQISKCMFIVT